MQIKAFDLHRDGEGQPFLRDGILLVRLLSFFLLVACAFLIKNIGFIYSILLRVILLRAEISVLPTICQIFISAFITVPTQLNTTESVVLAKHKIDIESKVRTQEMKR